MHMGAFDGIFHPSRNCTTSPPGSSFSGTWTWSFSSDAPSNVLCNINTHSQQNWPYLQCMYSQLCIGHLIVRHTSHDHGIPALQHTVCRKISIQVIFHGSCIAIATQAAAKTAPECFKRHRGMKFQAKLHMFLSRFCHYYSSIYLEIMHNSMVGNDCWHN